MSVIPGNPIKVGNFPNAIAITPDGTFAYVVNQGDGTVSVINTAANALAGMPIPAGNNPVIVANTRPDRCMGPHLVLRYACSKPRSGPSTVDS